ncbi:DNA/RNA non-specific endonuclease [Acinetobacter modestus]|uniref:DNA/RNA non-specific endonuclease n=1 Tax=Acinetobacter modestus TaxID=1776740 RepID=UPI0030B9ECC9
MSRRLGHSDPLAGLVPMDKAFNGSGGEWFKLETDWKKALEGNKSVKVNIQPVYSGNSKRPDSFIITQSIDSGMPRTLPRSTVVRWNAK